jgi:hypothetical protein
MQGPARTFASVSIARVSLVALLAGAAAACSSAPADAGDTADTDAVTELATNVTCGASYQNETTSGNAATSYGCYPGLSFAGTDSVKTFTATTAGDVVVSATDYNDYPFLIVLRDTGTGLNTANCVTADYYSVRFTAAANEKFHIVTDTDGSQPTTTFDLHVDCAAGSTEAVCDDGYDNDADYLIDCDDPDCTANSACNFPKCVNDGAIYCGDTLVFGGTSGFGSTDVVDKYSCWSDRVPNSPEHAYTFRAESSGWVNFTLSDFAQYPMLFVIEDDGTGCNPANCIDHNYYSSKFYAEAGKTYYLVADGWGETPYTFHASLICDPPSSESDCGNGLDDDGDSAPDCSDSDCDAKPECAAGICAAVLTIDCNTKLIHGDTGAVGSTDLVPSYSCSPNTDTTAREFTYQLGPVTKAGPILVTASNYTNYPLISVMEDNGTGCNPQNCVGEQYYSTKFTAKKGKTYYVTVEGDPSTDSMAYDLSVVCAPPTTEAGLCADDIDNDGDLVPDCLDSDCASACAKACTTQGSLAATTTLAAGNTAQGTNTANSYGCYPDIALPGNEYTYSFTPATTGQYLFTLSNETDYGTLAVLKKDATGCNTNACVAFNYYSVVASLTAGQQYYIAVDAPNAGTMTYDVTVVQNPPYNESGLCGDNIDNDGDFQIDCYDPDCGC